MNSPANNLIASVLAVIDPTAVEQPALERAAWLAGKVGARLELLVCYYNEYLAGTRFSDADSLRQVRENLLSDQRERLESLAEPLRATGLAVGTKVLWDHPLDDGIVRHAARINADLVFKDTHHHDVLERSIFSNTDWNLIRHCASPLWLVKPVPVAAEPLFLAAVDPLHGNDKPAALDDKILQLAAQLCSATNGQLHAFHAWDPRLGLTSLTDSAFVPAPGITAELEQELQGRHKERFQALATTHGVAPERSHLVTGPAHEELPALAKELEATVVVMGSVSRSRLQRLFIGSTAERTLEQLPCDLLVVKPDWYRTPDEVLADPAA